MPQPKKKTVSRRSAEGLEFIFHFEITSDDELIFKDVTHRTVSVKDIIDPAIIEGIYGEMYDLWILGITP